MGLYENIHDMAAHATFRKQVITACRNAANYILIEDPGVANHATRLLWAQAVLGYDGVAQSNVIQSMIVAATGNGTLQASAPSGPWLDNDIQYVVDVLIDVQAAGMA